MSLKGFAMAKESSSKRDRRRSSVVPGVRPPNASIGEPVLDDPDLNAEDAEGVYLDPATDQSWLDRNARQDAIRAKKFGKARTVTARKSRTDEEAEEIPSQPSGRPVIADRDR